MSCSDSPYFSAHFLNAAFIEQTGGIVSIPTKGQTQCGTLYICVLFGKTADKGSIQYTGKSPQITAKTVMMTPVVLVYQFKYVGRGKMMEVCGGIFDDIYYIKKLWRVLGPKEECDNIKY